MNKIWSRVPPGVQGLLPALACLLAGVSDRLYIDIDNFWISAAVSGAFGSVGLLPEPHPFLCWFAGALGRLLPTADCLALLSRIFLVLAFWWLGTALACAIPQQAKRLVGLLALTAILLNQSLFNKNFTIYSAVFAAVGMLTLLLVLRGLLPCGSAAAAAGWVALGVLWRPQCALLVLPFLALDAVLCLWQRQVTLRGTVRALAPCAAVIACLAAGTFAFYALNPAEWAGYQYNYARGVLVDFPTEDWAVVAEPLSELGISENDYPLLTQGLLIDTDFMTTETLQAVAEIAAKPPRDLSLASLRDALQDLADSLAAPMGRRTAVLCLVVLGFVLGSAAGWPTKVEALLGFGGSLLIALYFAWQGRLPERVMLAVLLVYLALLTTLWAAAPVRKHAAAGWLRRGLALALAGAAALTLWQNRRNYGLFQPAWEARAAAETTPAPVEEDAVYLWNPMALSLYVTEHYMDQGHLPSADFWQHNVPFAEWISGLPYFEEYLADLGISNPAKALLERPHTYLVAQSVKLYTNYFQEHYGAALTFAAVDSMEVFAVGSVPVWQLTTGSGDVAAP